MQADLGIFEKENYVIMSIVTQLTETRNATEKFYDLSPEELQKKYAPGKWTVKQILVHLADAESVLHERIKRTIAEPGQVLWAFNQDLWCAKIDYESFPLSISKQLFLANRESIIYLASKFYDSLGANQYTHSVVGIRTLKEEFDKVPFHNQAHLNQIMQAINNSK